MPMITKHKEPEFRIHTDLHSGHFSEGDIEANRRDTAYMALADAHTIARRTAEKLLEARKVALANEMQTEAANLEQFSKAHESALEQATNAVQSTLSRVGNIIAEIEGELSAPIASPTNPATASDIRAHVKELTLEQRRSFVSEAASSGDEETITAILSAPGYLSGLSNLEVERYREEYKRAQSPMLYQRLEMLRKAEQKVVNAGTSLVDLSTEIHRHDKQRTLAARAADEAARQALFELSGLKPRG